MTRKTLGRTGQTSKLGFTRFAISAVVVAAAAFALAFGGQGSTFAQGPEDAKGATPVSPATGKVIPGQYIITLKAGENPRSVAAIAKVSPMFVYESALNGFAAQLNDGQLNALRHNKAVETIERDQEVTGDGFVTQTIDSTGQPWGIDRVDQRSGLSRSYTYWSTTTAGAGRGVTAYIIDSGIATAHSDFGGRAMNVKDVFGGNGQDCHGHGTHVAGTVGGYKYGIAKAVKLRGVKVLGCDNKGSLTGIIAGIDWVRANAVKPAVANISIGAPFNAALNTATTNLVNSGVFVAVAAGNDNENACNHSPSSALGTLTVGGTDSADWRYLSSNYGGCVDLYAPAYNVMSASRFGGGVTMTGTSMASPHVAGVAALLKSENGDQASTTINSWILSATTINAVKGNVSTTPNKFLFMSGW